MHNLHEDDSLWMVYQIGCECFAKYLRKQKHDFHICCQFIMVYTY